MVPLQEFGIFPHQKYTRRKPKVLNKSHTARQDTGFSARQMLRPVAGQSGDNFPEKGFSAGGSSFIPSRLNASKDIVFTRWHPESRHLGTDFGMTVLLIRMKRLILTPAIFAIHARVFGGVVAKTTGLAYKRGSIWKSAREISPHSLPSKNRARSKYQICAQLATISPSTSYSDPHRKMRFPLTFTSLGRQLNPVHSVRQSPRMLNGTAARTWGK